jgi:ATP-dependent Lon protease
MNAEGGALLIGVTDTREVFGIETDYKTLGKKQDEDGFALWLNGLLDNMLGPTAASAVRLSFEAFPEGTVCRVDIEAGKAPTYVRRSKGQADLYVRLNNATRLLNTAEAVEYVRSRRR